MCQDRGVNNLRSEEAIQMNISIAGLDIAKNVFHVHGVDAEGKVQVSKALKRAKVEPFFAALRPCVVGLEACATAHHWARVLRALGHEARLIAPVHVKAYVRRNKTDAADAAAICEAASRPATRFVPVREVADQAAMALHRGRELLIKQRTMLINALRGHLAEFGVVAPRGCEGAERLCAIVADEDERRIPELLRPVLMIFAGQIDGLEAQIAMIEAQLKRWHAHEATSRRLATIPGVGLIIATALAAKVPDPERFASARCFAAWLGLTPRQHSTGGKIRLGPISKAGDRYIRRLLVNGAQSLLSANKRRQIPDPWLAKLLAHKPRMVAAVALANKLARIAWAVMTRRTNFRAAASA
jgi:transposase